MSRRSRSGSPSPYAALITNLREVQRALRLEEKYSANLSAVFFDHRPSDVSILARDGAVNTMRYMKVWFDLPEDVWFIAVNLLDRFLTRMKVQERFLACLIVSCLHVAASLRKINLDPQKLVTISQSKCSVKDLERMSDIVKQKLGIEDSELPITVLDFLYMFMKVMDSVVPERFRIKPVYENLAKKEFLVKRLEVVMANSVCASYRPTIVALSLLQTDIEFTYDSCIPSGYVYYSIEALHMLSCILNLQPMCKILPVDFFSCYRKIIHILEEYDDYGKICHSQKREWQRFSICTMIPLKPSDNFMNSLSPVRESENHTN